MLAAAAGVLGFTFLTDQPTLARVGVLIGGLAVALVMAWFSQPGKRFTPESEEGQWIARVHEGALRIKDIVARMNNITEIAEAPTIGMLPRMLDIKKSGRPVGEAR